MAHIGICNPTTIAYQHDPTTCQLHERTTFTCTADKLLVTIDPGPSVAGTVTKCQGNFQIHVII